MSFWKQALTALSEVAERPLALIGLVVITLAAALLHWKKAQFASLERSTAALPESDRLRAIRLHHGAQPQSGVSAESWLSSRRQLFVFWAYVSTLLGAVALVSIVLGTVSERPGRKHESELRADFSALDTKLAAYGLTAQNLRDAFDRAGARALDPDPQLDAELTRLILAYNAAYDDLQSHRSLYVESVVRWLKEQPEWATRVEDVVAYALDHVHPSGILGFNLFYEQALRARSASRDQGSATPARYDASGTDRDAGEQVRIRTNDISRLLQEFHDRRVALAKDILGHA